MDMMQEMRKMIQDGVKAQAKASQDQAKAQANATREMAKVAAEQSKRLAALEERLKQTEKRSRSPQCSPHRRQEPSKFPRHK